MSAALRHQREDVNRRERTIQKDREGVAHRAGVPNDCINVSDLGACAKTLKLHSCGTICLF